MASVDSEESQTPSWSEAGALEPGVEQNPAIYGGTAANYCGWPTAVYLDQGFSACSGTLVHPEIVITAAHCPSSTAGSATTIRFGEAVAGGERAVQATCYSNPGWTGQVGGTDFGYCRLSEPVTDVPIIPPAWGCDVSALSPGREVVIVGFGQSNNGGSGSKREVTTTIQAISSQAVVGGNGLDACQGDSGGPVYIKMSSDFGGDDTWRVFGITSGGAECGLGGIFALMHEAIPWVEQHSGVDITPCQDGDGNWEPSPQCGSIPLDPAAGSGDWANGCAGGPASGFGGLCGDPFGTGEDSDPPSVEVVTPNDGEEYDVEPGGTAQVTVNVTADDGDGFGVAEVRLLVNGDEFPNNSDTLAPYEWDLVMPEGGYTLSALAVDYSGNEAVSLSIGIGVGAEAPAGDDGGNDEVGDGTDGLGLDDGGLDSGCACSSASGSGGSGGAFGLLALIALAGLGRRRRN
ncbi:peptidase, S1 (chymotrypsin) family protein [Plesiocystis pacifica SIR-1]|uniref:Peptidase, S1 (Chymotrypsin) family protein n=1 Tax=Plesiocystis pacifica SIR-1 TaxID=391625 RepID=A6GJP3_9BACT|nr:peptidase, S1 (chymotrypsin) family protein [Plesiocystis pacifica SIR-1]